MKNYSESSKRYLQANGLHRVHLLNSVGEWVLAYKTEKQITAIEERGVVTLRKSAG